MVLFLRGVILCWFAISISYATPRTWYSYQSGPWHDPNTWTLDGGNTPLLINPGNETPGATDMVHITSGREVAILDLNGLTLADLRVDGVLDLDTSRGHNFTNLRGRGLIRLRGDQQGVDNFPAGTVTAFNDLETGGRVEYYGPLGTTLVFTQTRTFRELTINFDQATRLAEVRTSVEVLMDMRIERGTWQFGNSSQTTNHTLTVRGDLLVGSEGRVAVGTGNARHRLQLYGDLINQGDVGFTNRTSPNYTQDATNGIVDVFFLDNRRDQTARCEGPTRFYRIVMDKGADDTYQLNLEATNPAFFNLFGRADIGHGNTEQLTAPSNALSVLFGTLRVGPNVEIPQLSTNNNCNISTGVTLWVDGGRVAKTSGTAIVVYGKVRVTAGQCEASINSGFTMRGNGTLSIEETGTLIARQIRTSIFGSDNVGGYIQSGGTTTITGGAV